MIFHGAVLARIAVPAHSGAAAPMTLSGADGDLMRRILAESGVERAPTRPRLWSYFGDLLDAFFRSLFRSLSREALGEGVVLVGQVVALLVIAAAAALLLIAVARGARTRRRAGPRKTAAPGDLREDLPVPDMRDRTAWRAQVDALLSRGDVAGALRALWWWLARSLAPDGRIDPSRTTRELLVAARRMDLLRLGDGLDLLMYGRRSPSRSDVSSCLARFEEAFR